MAEEDFKTQVAIFVNSKFWIPTLVFLVGAAMFIVGMADGIKHDDWLILSQSAATIVSRVGGGLILVGLLLMVVMMVIKGSAANLPKARDFGITITHPVDNDIVKETDVRGTIKRMLPDGYSLHVFRMYPDKSFYPMREATVNKTAWAAQGCDVGMGDKRDFAVYLVGPAGAALLEYSREASRAHEDTRGKLLKLGGNADHLPLIKRKTPDMIECARVTVRKG